MKRWPIRIFLELDSYEKEKGALETQMILHAIEWQFDKIVDKIGEQSEVAWEAIKEADEIYINSALINSMFTAGSANMFNAFMHKAIQENVKGKKIYIFRHVDEIKWWNLNKRLFTLCFDNDVNELYTQFKGIDYTFEKVDADKIINDHL